MTPEERFRIVRSVGEECIQEDELLNLLTKKPEPICYDGFEPSGRMHIAQGVMKTISVNKMISAGCKVKICVADWFLQQTDEMGGNLKKIRTVGHYLIEIWKAAGMDLNGVEFIWSSEEINSPASEYWPLLLDIARKTNLPIMTSNEQDALSAASIIYSCMQCSDIFFLKADICLLGMDQRKVNVLAREYCDNIKRKNNPIILSHHMLPSLQQGQEKMSKSDPSSSIFMDDKEGDVNDKIKKAYCPQKIVQGNPCLEYIKFIIFPWFNDFKVERSAANGGDKTYTSHEELIADYAEDKLHPADLKPALSKALNKILQPIRDHFDNDAQAKDLLNLVKSDEFNCHPRTSKSNQPLPSAFTAFVSDLLSQLRMTPEERFRIVRSVGEECIQEDELLNLLTKKPEPICYDGFEPSGRMHIAQGIMKTLSVNKMTSAGCKVKILVADWFAQLNNKMGGDLEKIEKVGRYLIEVWKAAGMDFNGVEFLWSSKEINSRAPEYWSLVIKIAHRTNIRRIIRCVQIMGRNNQDSLTTASILYPCMQCADIFFLKADICQLGMDQRKVNVLAREYCKDIKRKNKPIILSHHMLPGLQQGQEKMSKSDPSSSIFMEDKEDAVTDKINEAYCPPKIVQGNPCLEYINFIIFPWFNEFKVERSAANGGDKTYTSHEELIADYAEDKLHPADLKPALSKALNKILQALYLICRQPEKSAVICLSFINIYIDCPYANLFPVHWPKPIRDHFNNDANAKDLLNLVKSYNVTK